MAMLRAVVLCSLAAVACGDSDDSDGDGASNGGGNGGGNGTPGMTGCDNGNGGSGETSCTQDEQDDYAECLANSCDAEKQKCFGPDYAKGTFGGACGSYIQCTTDCDCDATCTQGCGTPSTECSNCLLNDLNPCNTRECPIPECYTGGATGGGATAGGASHTCAELKACCDGMAAGATKDQCTQTYTGVMAGGDTGCSVAFSALMCK